MPLEGGAEGGVLAGMPLHAASIIARSCSASVLHGPSCRGGTDCWTEPAVSLSIIHPSKFLIKPRLPMPLYMKYGSIKGGGPEDGFKHCIELILFFSGGGHTASRGTTSREHSQPNLDQVTVTKLGDVAEFATAITPTTAGLNCRRWPITTPLSCWE